MTAPPRSLGRRLGVPTLAALVAIGSAPGATAQVPQAAPAAEAETAEVEAAEPEPASPPRRTLGALAGNVMRAALAVPTAANKAPLLLGASATVLALPLDPQTIKQISSPGSGSAKALEVGGGALVMGALTLGSFLGGHWGDAPRFKAASYDALQAALVNGLWTDALKRTVRRQRPSGENRLAFPSGHASNAFALATVYERHYGWKAAPGYALAGWIAYTRLQRDKHHLSDVVAGAALGHVVGRTVVRLNGGRAEAEGVRVRVTPLVGPATRGLTVTLGF